jgi:putative nucleotidyltransferase with HDIG domain
MRRLGLNLYVGALCVLSAVAVALVPWHRMSEIPVVHLFGLGVLIACAFISERLSVGVSITPRDTSHSITFILLLASIVLFGAPAPVIVLALTGGIVEIFFRRKGALRTLFNLAQYVLSTSIAGWSFEALGGSPAVMSDPFPLQLIPFFGFLLVSMTLNHGCVAVAISLDQGVDVRRVWKQLMGPAGGSALSDLLISPFALLVAFTYWQWGPLGLILSLLPLYFIRHAYLNLFRLQQTNRDLLRAMVKAIETRDPYTSGHSQRVSRMARAVAERMGLSAKRTETIEMAALLHDIGKIDVVYSELLRKPDALNPAERAVMEAHVIKGVEFLRSLSSVSDEVVAGVQHHHEREDGNGYPGRVAGPDIPLAAKIIRVCDSVDAMLSDRPYRRALSVGQVRDELIRCAGSEFDQRVVDAVFQGEVLEQQVRVQIPRAEVEPPGRLSRRSWGMRATAAPVSVDSA